MLGPVMTSKKAWGFTMIELMIGLAILGVLVALAAPSLREIILMQRLRGVNAQLVTDMQYARAEAAARGRYARVALGSNASQTCYVIYTANNSGSRCDCTLGAGAACPAGNGRQEIRTVSVDRSSGVSLAWPAGQDPAFGFDHITGGLISVPTDSSVAPLERVRIDALIDDNRQLRNTILQTGRITVCAPNPAVMQVTGC